MPFFSISVMFIIFSCVALFYIIAYMISKDRSPQKWEVQIKMKSDWVHSDEWGYTTVNNNKQIQIRIVGPNKQQAVFGNLDVDADDFEEQLFKLQQEAFERASSLNAYISA